MDQFQTLVKTEIASLNALLESCKLTLDQAPAGCLFVRKGKRKTSYYQIYKEKTSSGWKNIHRNITDCPELISVLSEKQLAQETAKRCRANLKLLKNTAKLYRPYDRELLMASLSDNCKELLTLRRKQQVENWFKAPYKKAPFDPKYHIHETAYGELVRSKSEVIIANALFTYGIPFHYEELFPYPNENGDFYYPDFTILLPEGNRLYWEHFGLLKDLSYCVHNAQKLHTFQHNQVFLGKNLILTQDDALGNCNSAFAYQIIEQHLLPLFDGCTVSPEYFRTLASPRRC